MVTRLIALFLLLGSLVPFAELIPGGERDAAYLARLEDWALGTALCAAIGALVWYVLRARQRGRAGTPVTAVTSGPFTPSGADVSHAEAANTSPDWPFTLALTAAALVLYAAATKVTITFRRGKTSGSWTGTLGSGE